MLSLAAEHVPPLDRVSRNRGLTIWVVPARAIDWARLPTMVVTFHAGDDTDAVQALCDTTRPARVSAASSRR